MNQCYSPQSNQNTVSIGKQRPNSSVAARAAPNPPKASLSPLLVGWTPGEVQHSRANMRKHKTGSLVPGESIYYDSAVQAAFLELVKFISTSLNAMRKGKLQAKMIKMKVAVQKIDEDDDDEIEVGDVAGNLVAQQTELSTVKQEESSALGDPGNVDAENLQDLSIPKQRFVSTRDMGHMVPKADSSGSTPGLWRGYGRSGGEDTLGIFDELVKGLEWSQRQCEHAAHQFLNDGECSKEIEGVKRKLAEVKEKAEREIERLKGEEKEKNAAVLNYEPEDRKEKGKFYGGPPNEKI